jgi:hypothetical protein
MVQDANPAPVLLVMGMILGVHSDIISGLKRIAVRYN